MTFRTLIVTIIANFCLLSAANAQRSDSTIVRYGVTVAMVNGHVTENRLADIAGKTRNVPDGCELLTVARRMGISLG